MGNKGEKAPKDQILFPDISTKSNDEDKGKMMKDFFLKGAKCSVKFIIPMLAKMNSQLMIKGDTLQFCFDGEEFYQECIQKEKAKSGILSQLGSHTVSVTPPEFDRIYFRILDKKYYYWMIKDGKSFEFPKELMDSKTDVGSKFIKECITWVLLREIVNVLPKIQKKGSQFLLPLRSNEHDLLQISLGFTREKKVFISLEFPESKGLLQQIPLFFEEFYSLKESDLIDVPEIIKQKEHDLPEYKLESLVLLKGEKASDSDDSGEEVEKKESKFGSDGLFE